MAAVAAAILPSMASAQNCKNPESQIAMNTCAARDYEREDARLNKAYRDVIAKLEPAKREKLREVQRLWLSYRDLNCDFQTDDYVGGTMYSLVHSICLTEMSKQRTKDLKAMLEEASM
ncbi:MAG TPA: lysozyme inhibitor LprI family protein [Ramlibacter sp.]|uniref:lysozyme inhibitor LprI family protein n=1 Tax=Ramlibacter sp. TaxID=1917967 RepID=UPI002BF02BE5|nr:lysozyme inhibitor LprI family protein [Ramlibacter sp.]HVZ42519.1 lysozyme inhibitor LprI family protein [Ramlibacter sp.]